MIGRKKNKEEIGTIVSQLCQVAKQQWTTKISDQKVQVSCIAIHMLHYNG